MDNSDNKQPPETTRLPDNYVTPRLLEEFESQYRKEKLMQNKLTNDRQCALCKIVSGTLFGGFGLFHAYRVVKLWSYYPLREKVFNVVALGVIFMLSSLSYNAGYQIHMG